MPIYDYTCPRCGTRSEVHFHSAQQRDMAEHELRCDCGEPLLRVVSVPAAPVVHGYNAANGYSKGRA